MIARAAIALFLGLWAAGLWIRLDDAHAARRAATPLLVKDLSFDEFFNRHLLRALPIADGFDFPLRPPHAEGVQVANPFWSENADGLHHAGENWNTAPGDQDRGEPVYAVADGWVLMALDFAPPWGKVVSIASRLPDGVWPAAVETVYTHLDSVMVEPLQTVKRGQQIGTIGNADGLYHAHLNWEVRPILGLGLSPGYTLDSAGWLDPRGFISTNRPHDTPPELQAGKMSLLAPEEWTAWGSDESTAELPK
jgi:murein DD-endopeptidase MepM/ murein hydrolase activator NlpD